MTWISQKGADLMRYVLLLLLIPLTSSANIEKPKDEINAKGMNLQLDIAKALGRECRGA